MVSFKETTIVYLGKIKVITKFYKSFLLKAISKSSKYHHKNYTH